MNDGRESVSWQFRGGAGDSHRGNSISNVVKDRSSDAPDARNVFLIICCESFRSDPRQVLF
jgi:hypothetical protein